MRNKTALVSGSALGLMLAFGLGAAAHAQDNTVSWKGAPQWTNDDTYFKVRGRILLDAVFQDVSRDGPGGDFKTSNTRGRQVFLGVEGKLNNYIAYKAEGGAVNGGAWAWDDVVIEYKPTEDTSLLFGNVKVAGIENLTSTRFITFMDRGPYGDFGVDSYSWASSASKIGSNYSGDPGRPGRQHQQRRRRQRLGRLQGTPGRHRPRHWAPIVTDTDKVHLAASYRYRNRGDEGAFAYTGRTTTAYSNATFYTTGAIGNRDNTIGPRRRLDPRSVSIQGEYSSIDVTRQNPAALAARIRPSRSATPSSASGRRARAQLRRDRRRDQAPEDPQPGHGRRHWGGLELAVRYDFADLTDAYDTLKVKPATSQSGKYTGWTLGANYYPTPYVRFQANYTDGKSNNIGLNQDFDIKQFQLRAQLDF
jgi:phosphate-selective porin OprO/OprP